MAHLYPTSLDENGAVSKKNRHPGYVVNNLTLPCTKIVLGTKRRKVPGTNFVPGTSLHGYNFYTRQWLNFGAGYNFCPRHPNSFLKKIINKDMKLKTNYSQPAGYKWAIDRKKNLLVRQEPYPSGQKSYDGDKIFPHGSALPRTNFCPRHRIFVLLGYTAPV